MPGIFEIDLNDRRFLGPRVAQISNWLTSLPRRKRTFARMKTARIGQELDEIR
jgi:hypothetical protein